MEYENKNTALRSVNTVMMWLFCLTVLFLVIPWKEFAPGIAQRMEENRLLVYLALVIEISNFISQSLIAVFSRMHEKKMVKVREENMARTVEGMDFAERALLREFVLQRKSVLNVPLNEPTVRSLLQSRVLQVAGASSESKTPVVISKVARPYITYKAIGLSRSKMSDDQLEQILGSRPSFARERVQPKSYRGGGSFKAA
ncbi:MAG: superinfection exclusion B family protein [Succinivibrio sp.]|nr:superinfection exclusion B family protein [Succinivibrio sp.]